MKHIKNTLVLFFAVGLAMTYLPIAAAQSEPYQGTVSLSPQDAARVKGILDSYQEVVNTLKTKVQNSHPSPAPPLPTANLSAKDVAALNGALDSLKGVLSEVQVRLANGSLSPEERVSVKATLNGTASILAVLGAPFTKGADLSSYSPAQTLTAPMAVKKLAAPQVSAVTQTPTESLTTNTKNGSSADAMASVGGFSNISWPVVAVIIILLLLTVWVFRKPGDELETGQVTTIEKGRAKEVI